MWVNLTVWLKFAAFSHFDSNFVGPEASRCRMTPCSPSQSSVAQSALHAASGAIFLKHKSNVAVQKLTAASVAFV